MREVSGNAPTVSVIIPVYNGAATIGDTIDSILVQTRTDFELIIINDGSTDHTLSVVSAFKDSRIKVHSFENKGLSASRNRGIDLSCGKYISFIDADDQWLPEKLSGQVEALEKKPGAAVAYSWTTLFDETRTYPAEKLYYQDNIVGPLLRRNFIGSGSNILARREAIRETGYFDETLKSCEDWDYFLRLAKRFHYTVVPRADILYRISSASMSSRIDEMLASSTAVVKKALAENPGYSVAGVLSDRFFALSKIALGRAAYRTDVLKAGNLLIQSLPVKLMQPKEVLAQSLKIIILFLLSPALYRTLKGNRACPG